MLGETTFISFEIRNFSKQNLSTSVGGDYRNNIGRPDSYTVNVVREDELTVVPQPKVTFWGGGLTGAAILPANGSYITKLFLPHWATFEKTGTYIITVTKSFGIMNSATKVRDTFEANVSTKIKIIPIDKVKLGEIIDSLGQTMLDENNIGYKMADGNCCKARDALMLLKFINDKRTIKYLIEALEKYAKATNDWDAESTYSAVASALAKYNDDSAMEALKNAASSSNKEVRLDVADALRIIKHPQAIEVLLKMRTDSYWLVRLRVVQALGDIESEESSSLLREMLKDKNEEVREQAQEYLNKRTK